jgi:hypothetical protein
MREYGSVHTCFWTHCAIQSLSDHAKLLALYLLTGPHTNMLGCFRLPVGYICEDLGWQTEQVFNRLEELADINFARYETSYYWIMISQFLTWNPIENPNQGKSICRLFEQVPKKVCFFSDLVNILLANDKYLEDTFKESLLQLPQSEKKSASPIKEHYSAVSESRQDDPAKIITEAKTPIITITLNNQREFPLVQSQVDEWQLLYPAVDVLQALRNIRAWNQANPTRRKTKSGILRHVVAWLAKEQNQAKPHEVTKMIREPINHLHARNLAVANDWLNQIPHQTIHEVNITTNEVNP